LRSFRFDRGWGVARGVKAFLNPQSGTAPEGGQHGEIPSDTREFVSEYNERIQSKKRELIQIQRGLRAAKDQTELIEHKRRRKRTQQEIFRLESELRAAENEAAGEPVAGALPDFAIIGARKAGTTFLYNLLIRHSHVQPAAVKEVHYFDNLIEEEDAEWYSQCFPKPRYEDGRRTITGEATPYMPHHLAPERMARVVPEARLIALLRNPVERAYSDYYHVARRGHEPLPFEEAIRLEEAAMVGRKPQPSVKPSDTRSETSEGEEGGVGLGDHRGYLSRGIYVDQLLRWRRFFPEERMLVLKSEELFGRTPEILKLVLDFLELPAWELEAREETPAKRNQGNYERRMGPATRRWLERFFEPHNQRLYAYLGVDFGW
jgi:hypothetical protein